MPDDCYLWYELCDTFEEHYHFIKNELDHYSIVFTQRGITNLSKIVDELTNDLRRVYITYSQHKTTLNEVISNEESDWNTYYSFSVMKYLLHDVWDRFQYIVYSIFDRDIRIRLDHDEISKNHVVSRNLCRHFIDKIRSNYEVTVESHFGYDLSYYWMSLTTTQKGIINAPRINSYCTRLLPIYCHEVTHPIIELNTREILGNEYFRSFFVSVHDYILSHYLLLDNAFSREEVEKVTSSVFSEILADTISTLVCQESYVLAFCTSELWPQDKMLAKEWLSGGSWKTHPPNEMRFLICNNILRILEKNEIADRIENDWIRISSLQDDYHDDEPYLSLNLLIENLIREINLDEIIQVFTTPDSPILINTIPSIEGRNLEDVSYQDDPIAILNAIWNTRLSRFSDGENQDDRLTSQALKKLHYSLMFRRT